MQDPPSIATIRELAAQTGETRTKFEERLAAAALELVARAEVLALVSDAAERERLVALLGEEGGLAELNRRLCAKIRDGAPNTPALMAHLRATTMEKLAVDQPTYAAYRRALERSEG